MDRDRHLVDWLHAGNYHGMWGAIVMVIYSGVAFGAGFPAPLRGHPVLLMLLAAATGFVIGKAVGSAVLHGSGRAAQTVYMPSAKGSYTAQHSHIDALEARGDYAGAVDAWEKVAIAQPGNPWPLIRAGELYLRTLNDPSLALERFRGARDIPGITREHHVYVSQKIIDLYLGPLADHGRALVELRRFVEVHAGTREGALARDALARLKAEREAPGA